MNLRISALEKVARIGCKYDLSFLLNSCWALPSGGFAEGQLALSSHFIISMQEAISMYMLTRGKQSAADSSAGGRTDKLPVMITCRHLHSGVKRLGGSVNLCRSSDK